MTILINIFEGRNRWSRNEIQALKVPTSKYLKQFVKEREQLQREISLKTYIWTLNSI